MRRIRLVIADRRPIVLQGFATLFSTERDFEIVASCITGADCLEAVRTLTPDVALVEDGFSDVAASAMLAAVSAENLSTRLVFYTASIARGDLAAAIAAGACAAIPMREEPENLLQSLRLVAPAAARRAGHGAFGENGPAALTDQEHKIIRLAASGMSNKEIARQIKVAPARVEARIEQISAQLGIRSRTELARFALSRLYGGVGAIAALIWAALDDIQPASATAADHADADTVTVMTADGAGAVVTIKISPQKTAAALEKTGKAVGKVLRLEHSPADMPTRTGKLIESRADVAGSTITVPTVSPPRTGSSSFGPFMMTAVGISIYELLSSQAQASTVWDSPSDVFAWADAKASGELVALNGRGSPELNGFDQLPWLNPDISHESFAFEAALGDAMTRGYEPQIVDAAAREHSFSGSDTPHVGSGAVDALSDRGGREQAAATSARNAEHGPQATTADALDREQPQRDLHASEEGSAKGKPHAEHEPPGHDPDHGKSQRDTQASEDDAAGDKKHAKQDSTGNDSNPGKVHHASKDDSAATKQDDKNDGPGNHSNPGQSQRDSHPNHSDDSPKLHAEPSQKAGGNGQAKHDTGPAHTAAAAGAGDSFHFKNDMAAGKGSDHHAGGYRANTVEHGSHGADNIGPPIQDADLIGPSHAEQGAVDQARGVEHHPTHDFFV